MLVVVVVGRALTVGSSRTEHTRLQTISGAKVTIVLIVVFAGHEPAPGKVDTVAQRATPAPGVKAGGPVGGEGTAVAVTYGDNDWR